MKPTILLAEDEEHLQDVIKLNLELENYSVTTVNNGEDAVNSFHKNQFDLLILDVMMPKLDGFEVCKQIRKVNSDVPVLFLTARDSSTDKIEGFTVGADDYLVKPFNLEEFLLRVKVLLKRSLKTTTNTFEFGINKIDFKSFEVTGINGTETLTIRDIDLLKLLVTRKNEVVSRDEILDAVWGKNAFPTSRTIDNYILGFRKLFEEDSKNPKHFLSIRGVGYKFVE